MSPEWSLILNLSLLACGEDRKFTAEQLASAPKTESTDAGEIGLCSYTVISDRFALTAEHCNIGYIFFVFDFHHVVAY